MKHLMVDLMVDFMVDLMVHWKGGLGGAFDGTTSW